MEQTFLKRAIELTKGIQLAKTLKEADDRAAHLEGFLTGAMEIFAVLSEHK